LPLSPRAQAEPSPNSITITDWNVDLANLGGVTLQCWDFAGAELHSETLQMFLTERAIYVVVFRLRASDAFEHCNAWCASIFARAPQASVSVV
jgi:hypothetical protein